MQASHRYYGDAPVGPPLGHRRGDAVMGAGLHAETGRPGFSQKVIQQNTSARAAIAIDHDRRVLRIRHGRLDHPGHHVAGFSACEAPVVGAKDDPRSASLYKAALAYAAVHKRADWWDRAEGPLPNNTVAYPELAKPAAFACSGNICSLPVTNPRAVAAALDRLLE